MKGHNLTFSLLLACGVLSGGVPSLPLVFEQHSDGCLARTVGGSVFITKDGALLRSSASGLRIRLEGARPSKPEAEQPLHSVSNYLKGNDADKWRRGVPHFAKVRSRGVYPGIDLVYYGKDGSLEYDFVLAPGAEPRNISLIVDGAKKLRTDEKGDLLIDTGAGTIRQLKPVIYQADGRQIDGRYQVAGRNRVRFVVGDYDRSRELVIDPVIQYTRYIGRLGQESATGIAIDPQGNVIVVGETTSEEFASGTAFQRIRNPDNEAFVAKLDQSGNVIFQSYLGGNGPDTGRAVALDAAGNIFVGGTTASTDFPMRNPAQATYGGGEADGFVAKIASAGTDILFSTYVGGSGFDFLNGVAADPSGSVWVSGWTTSPNFPVRGGYQSGPAGGGGDVFVSEFDPNRGGRLYSSYVGSNGNEIAGGIAVDTNGFVWVTGSTTSSLSPETGDTVRPAGRQDQDMFVFRLNPVTNTLAWRTFGGTGEDVGVSVAADRAGNAFVAGYSDSTNLPVTTGVAQNANRGGTDMFVVKMNLSGVQWATYLGGTGDDFPGAITVDGAGSPYVAGWTNSTNFPLKGAIQPGYQGGNFASQRYDMTVTRLNPGGDQVLFSSYLGGIGEDKAYAIALDRSNNIYVGGNTTSSNLPGALNAFGSSSANLYDAVAIRLSADTSISFLGANPGVLNLTAKSSDTQALTSRIELAGTAGSVTFTTTSNQPWLRADPVSGTAPGNITITVDPTKLVPGANSGEVRVQSTSNTVVIPVFVTQVVVPTIASISPTSLPRGAADPTITITGTGFTGTSRIEVNGTTLQTTVVDTQTLRTVLPAYLLTAEGTLTVAVVNADARSATVSLAVGNVGPIVTAAGIVSAATNQTGAIAPGEILLVYGTQFGASPTTFAAPANGVFGTSLNGVSVLFDGVAAPILWVDQGKAAVVAPYALSGKPQTQIVVNANGNASQPVTVPVQASQPGLFTANFGGTGQAAAQNADGSANSASNPAARGSVLVLFGTGEGLMGQTFQTGQVVPVGTVTKPQLPVSVMIGGVPAAVEYVGPSPGQVAGLLQINVRVPENVTEGNAVPVLLQIGDFTSMAGVTVAIR